MSDVFRAGWPVQTSPAELDEDGKPLPATFQLSNGSKVEGEEEALKAEDALPWPKPSRPPGGKRFVTSDRFRFAKADRATEHQASVDEKGKKK